MLRLFLIMFCLIFTACIPAKTPPQLVFTPGAPVKVTDQLYHNETYQVVYPTGWRVITSSAENPSSVILAAPDNQGLIMISANPIDQAPALPDVDDQQIENQTHALDDNTTLYIVLVVDETFQDTLSPVFETIIATIDKPSLLIPTFQPRM